MQKILIVLIFLFCNSALYAADEKQYLVVANSSNKAPSFESLMQAKNITNPKLLDKNGVERFIFWNEISSISPTKNIEILELQKLISFNLRERNQNFYLLKDSSAESNVIINFLVKTNDNSPIQVEVIGSWVKEDSVMLSSSKQKLIATVAKSLNGYKFASNQTLISLTISNSAEVRALAISNFYGLCRNLISLQLRRHSVNMDVDFDFEINSEGIATIKRADFAEGDETVSRYFRDWLSGCKFNSEIFEGTNHLSKKVKVVFN
jgi:hypothetical protein